MSDQPTEQKSEEIEQPDDCRSHCAECGEPIWYDCYYCEACLHDFKYGDQEDWYDED